MPPLVYILLPVLDVMSFWAGRSDSRMAYTILLIDLLVPMSGVNESVCWQGNHFMSGLGAICQGTLLWGYRSKILGIEGTEGSECRLEEA